MESSPNAPVPMARDNVASPPDQHQQGRRLTVSEADRVAQYRHRTAERKLHARLSQLLPGEDGKSMSELGFATRQALHAVNSAVSSTSRKRPRLDRTDSDSGSSESGPLPGSIAAVAAALDNHMEFAEYSGDDCKDFNEDVNEAFVGQLGEEELERMEIKELQSDSDSESYEDADDDKQPIHNGNSNSRSKQAEINIATFEIIDHRVGLPTYFRHRTDGMQTFVCNGTACQELGAEPQRATLFCRPCDDAYFCEQCFLHEHKFSRCSHVPHMIQRISKGRFSNAGQPAVSATSEPEIAMPIVNDGYGLNGMSAEPVRNDHPVDAIDVLCSFMPPTVVDKYTCLEGICQRGHIDEQVFELLVLYESKQVRHTRVTVCPHCIALWRSQNDIFQSLGEPAHATMILRILALVTVGLWPLSFAQPSQGAVSFRVWESFERTRALNRGDLAMGSYLRPWLDGMFPQYTETSCHILDTRDTVQFTL
jgi:hypothetical protein